MREERLMRRFLVALGLSLLMATPLVVAAAGDGSSGENLVPAVDQLMARDMIQLAQSQMKIAGYNPGRVDGIFDQRTSDALRKYQVAKGLPVSGLLDEPTRRELLSGYQEASDD
jgi:peptidoglycan hydrolase-like protein with peptidoglycan-binding domain